MKSGNARQNIEIRKKIQVYPGDRRDSQPLPVSSYCLIGYSRTSINKP